ncbi:tetratricopeptide repeat protein [Candidatus Pelagibacter bacterium nBUS_29]|uniref:tetratricopeptide repeat protein n=1 Tax=Candidatus Pelagibacter bacterium nBUS_29 TaxID=3374190 RepID=UPI003EBF294A
MKKISDNLLEPSQQQLNNLLKYYQTGQYIDAEKLSLSITQEFPKHQFAWKVLAAVLKQKGRINESLIVSQKSVQLDPQDAGAHYNLGITLQELGRLEEAETSYRQTISLRSDLAEVHHNLGIILQEQGRFKEAEASYRQSITLKPDLAQTHHSLGNVMLKQGKLKEAEASYRQSITLKPNLAKAHNNLGIILKKQGRLEEAEASYRQAIKLKPDLAQAHSNLGVIMREHGRLEEACSAFIQVINLKPDFTDAYANFAIAIKKIRFTLSNIKLYPILIQLLNTGNYVRPSELAPSILSLLKHDPLIKNLLLEENFATNLKEANSIISSLDKLTLLHHLMRVCPLPDLQFEKFFVNMRSLILTNLDNFDSTPEFIHFLSNLSLHCFTNEYIYFEKDEETKLIKNLENEITQSIAKSEQPEAKKILCLASYRLLHQYNWCQKIEALDNLIEVKFRLIEEPYSEKAIVTEIPILGKISDNVSSKVRAQYEENPYPRWVKIGLASKAKLISEISDEENLHLHSKSIKNVIAPDILVAGCGTGQHSIGTASRFSDCQVTAIDLSLASLAYAKRKTTELGITNLEYLQADILLLNQLKKKFDIIESVGVLHHMDEPMAGWRVLTDLLKPGGLMKIGLYSELARQPIVEIRKEIILQKVGTTEADIRKFRQSLVESKDEYHQRLTTSNDFFSLSTLRDLIFHVQEHRFTLPQIKKCLEKLGLKFCGFENNDLISNFKKFYRKEVDIYDLALWHQYEEINSRSFGGMYVFWCQKL